MNKHVIMIAALGGLIAAPALSAVSAADKQFATEAAQGGLAEVEMAQLAVQKAESPQVKQFAQRMVADHTLANQELMQVGKEQGLDLPAQPDAKHKGELDQMREMNGATFDTMYMQHQVQDHQKTIAEFQKEAQSGSASALQAFAQKYLPTLKQHLQMAQAAAPKG